MGAYDNPRFIQPTNYLAGMQEFNRSFAMWYSIMDKKRQARKKKEEEGDAKYAKWIDDSYVDPIDGLQTNTELSINEQIQSSIEHGDFQDISHSERALTLRKVKELKNDLTGSAKPLSIGFDGLDRSKISNNAYQMALEMHNSGKDDSTFRIDPGFINANGTGIELIPGQFGLVYSYEGEDGERVRYNVKDVAAMFQNYAAYDDKDVQSDIDGIAQIVTTEGENINKDGNALGTFAERNTYEYYNYDDGASNEITEYMDKLESHGALQGLYANKIAGAEGFSYLPSKSEINEDFKNNRKEVETMLGVDETFDDFLLDNKIDDTELALYHAHQKKQIKDYLTNAVNDKARRTPPKIGVDPQIETDANFTAASSAAAIEAAEAAKLFKNGGTKLTEDELNVYNQINGATGMILDLLTAVELQTPTNLEGLVKWPLKGDQLASLNNYYNYTGGDVSKRGNDKRFIYNQYELTLEKLQEIVNTGVKIDEGTQVEFASKWDEQVYNKYKSDNPRFKRELALTKVVRGGQPISTTDKGWEENIDVLGKYSRMDITQILSSFEGSTYLTDEIQHVRIGESKNGKIKQLNLTYVDGNIPKYKDNDKVKYPNPTNLGVHKINIATKDSEGNWKRNDEKIKEFLRDWKRITNQKEIDNFPTAYSYILDSLGLEEGVASGLPTN